jgi:hypothetical protein
MQDHQALYHEQDEAAQELPQGREEMSEWKPASGVQDLSEIAVDISRSIYGMKDEILRMQLRLHEPDLFNVMGCMGHTELLTRMRRSYSPDSGDETFFWDGKPVVTFYGSVLDFANGLRVVVKYKVYGVEDAGDE